MGSKPWGLYRSLIADPRWLVFQPITVRRLLNLPPNLYAIRNRRAGILASIALLPGKGRILDSYIIRIYRRGADRGHEVAGLIERVGNGQRQAFGSSEELWTFLTDRQPSRRRGARGKQGSKTHT